MNNEIIKKVFVHFKKYQMKMIVNFTVSFTLLISTLLCDLQAHRLKALVQVTDNNEGVAIGLKSQQQNTLVEDEIRNGVKIIGEAFGNAQNIRMIYSTIKMILVIILYENYTDIGKPTISNAAKVTTTVAVDLDINTGAVKKNANFGTQITTIQQTTIGE